MIATNLFNLSQQRVLITASGGVGFQIARGLAKQGALVIQTAGSKLSWRQRLRHSQTRVTPSRSLALAG